MEIEFSQKELKILKKKSGLLAELKKHWILYCMLVPGIIYFIIFKYLPMGGLIIAFQDYAPYKGILGSPFVGVKHFVRLFTGETFFQLLKNTLVLSAMNIVFAFPMPIILALMLNEVKTIRYKKSIQTIVYLPNFLSWVIVVSMFYVLLTTEGGAINNVLSSLGMEKIQFLTSSEWLRPLYIFQEVWKSAGWSSIIYLASLTTVDEQLYEAAEIDGAGRFRQMWHITLPAIRPTIIIMLILRVGEVLELGFDHMFLMMNSLNRDVAQIFDTFVYTTGIQSGHLSFATSAGMFKSVIGLILVLFVNRLAKQYGEEGVF